MFWTATGLGAHCPRPALLALRCRMGLYLRLCQKKMISKSIICYLSVLVIYVITQLLFKRFFLNIMY